MIRVSCANGHVVRVPDEWAGNEVRCPQCKATIRVVGPQLKVSAPADDSGTIPLQDDDDDLPPRSPPPGTGGAPLARAKKPKAKSGQRSWRERLPADERWKIDVERGLLLHRWRMLAYTNSILAIMLLPLAAFFFAAGGVRSEALVGVVFLGIITATALAAPLLGILGSLACQKVPADAGRGCVTIAWIMDAVQMVLGLATLGLFFLRPQPAVILSAVGGAAEFAAWIFLFLFLQHLAAHLDKNHLAEESLILLIKGLLVRVLLFVLPGVAYLFSANLGEAVQWTLLLIVFVWLPILIWFVKHFLNFLDELRVALRGEELPDYFSTRR